MRRKIRWWMWGGEGNPSYYYSVEASLSFTQTWLIGCQASFSGSKIDPHESKNRAKMLLNTWSMDLQKNPSMKSCRVHSQVVAKADVGYRYATSGKVVTPCGLVHSAKFRHLLNASSIKYLIPCESPYDTLSIYSRPWRQIPPHDLLTLLRILLEWSSDTVLYRIFSPLTQSFTSESSNLGRLGAWFYISEGS